MRRIQDIARVLLVVTGLLTLTGTNHIITIEPVAHENQQENTNQPDENQTCTQSFDVVSQNVQLQFSSIFLTGSQIIETDETIIMLVNTSFKLVSTKFFEIFFEQIISPNAP